MAGLVTVNPKAKFYTISTYWRDEPDSLIVAVAYDLMEVLRWGRDAEMDLGELASLCVEMGYAENKEATREFGNREVWHVKIHTLESVLP